MSNHATVNMLIVDDDDKARAKLIDKLRYPDLRVVGESSFGPSAVSWASRLAVDVVIVVVEEPVARGLRTVELLTTDEANYWPVVAVSTEKDRAAMRKAMLAGARDYIGLPASGDDLRKAIIRVYQREQERRGALASGGGAAQGNIITVFGVKGGIGKSVTAVNIAAAIAQGSLSHVALVDADVQFGDCALMLDLVPARTIVDAASEADPSTPHLIEPYLTDHASRVSLLAAPVSPRDADHVTPDLVGNVLKSLAATHDFVITDTSPQIDAVSAQVIDLSTIVLVVVNPEVHCVRRTRAALDLLEAAGYSQDKIKLLLNRASKRSEVPKADLQAALGYPIYAEIPDDPAVARSITRGVPVVMADARSAAGRAYLELGRGLAGLSDQSRGGRWPWRRSRDFEQAPVPAPPNPVTSDALIAAWAPALGQQSEPAGTANGELDWSRFGRSWDRATPNSGADAQSLDAEPAAAGPLTGEIHRG
jgi:pilus assembly protein CpaE